MTGFGRGKYENAGREYIVEIKGVNYKYNDIIVKLPRNISYLEDKVKKEVRCSLIAETSNFFFNILRYHIISYLLFCNALYSSIIVSYILSAASLFPKA